MKEIFFEVIHFSHWHQRHSSREAPQCLHFLLNLPKVMDSKEYWFRKIPHFLLKTQKSYILFENKTKLKWFSISIKILVFSSFLFCSLLFSPYSFISSKKKTFLSFVVTYEDPLQKKTSINFDKTQSKWKTEIYIISKNNKAK